MRIVATTMILIMLTSTLSGCTTSDEDENIIEIGIISPVEGDWGEGKIQVSIATKMTKSETIEIWINNNYYSTEELGVIKDFNIDSSLFSYGSSSPVNLNIELRHQNESISEVNITALFPQQMTFWTSEDIQPEFDLNGELLFKSSRGLESGI